MAKSTRRARLILAVLVLDLVPVAAFLWEPAWEWVTTGTAVREQFINSELTRGYITYNRWASPIDNPQPTEETFYFVRNGFKQMERFTFPRTYAPNRMTRWRLDGTVEHQILGGEVKGSPPWWWGVTDQTEPTAPWWKGGE